MKATKKVPFTLRIDERMLQEIRIQSAKQKKSMSDIIVEKILKGEEKYDKKNSVPGKRSR